ncbi:MAG: phage holin family protein [Atopobiaceae bacterium]|nr:phage holin family protein [Atopobiaceae bacterium]
MQFIATWIVSAVACAIAINFVPGITAVGGSYAGPIMCALALALVNATVKPVTEFFSFPLTVVTFGLFLLVINALMLMLAGNLSVGLFGSGIQIDSFGSALLGSIVISIATTILNSIMGL